LLRGELPSPRELTGIGLTVAQLGLMAQIAITSDDTPGALAQRTGLDQSTLSRNLRTLEGEGLIEIAVVETDLRRRAVWLAETSAAAGGGDPGLAPGSRQAGDASLARLGSPFGGRVRGADPRPDMTLRAMSQTISNSALRGRHESRVDLRFEPIQACRTDHAMGRWFAGWRL
jgi:DNA-binding transcriptional ArsR family regulator